MDLIVWYDDDSIARFELYYDKNTKEHVIIWIKLSVSLACSVFEAIESVTEQFSRTTNGRVPI